MRWTEIARDRALLDRVDSRLPSRTARLGLVLLCLAWIIPGLVGHDPWKPDEAYTFGLVYHIVRSGHWIVPRLAGEPFMEKPPLYYLVAAGFWRALSPPLAPQDAARLTSGFFMALVLLFAGLSGRELYGRGKGMITVVILIGCLGLLIRTHQLITDVALLAGLSIALHGFAVCLRRPIAGGVGLGLGAGIAFMSKGLLGPGMLGLLGLALPAVSSTWRTRDYLKTLAVATLVSAPWLIIWPIALYARSPALFMQWFWVNNLGRFVGFAHIGPTAYAGYYFQTVPWFAWPAWPIALWALWHEGKAGLRRPEIHFPLVAFVVFQTVLGTAAEARDVYALPLLLPLATLATAGVDTLRRGAANALYWFAITTFTFFAVVFWFYWVALTFGVPASLSAHLNDMQPGYTPAFHALPFLLAVLYTVGWLLAVARLKRFRARPVVIWAIGITMVWGLAMTLFISWINTGKSYRTTFIALAHAMPPSPGCISSEHLGEGQRALLQYYDGIVTRRVEVTHRLDCPLLIVQSGRNDHPDPGPEWRLRWSGHRPGDEDEIYRLFQKTAVSPAR